MRRSWLIISMLCACHGRPKDAPPQFTHRPDTLFAGTMDSLIISALEPPVTRWHFILLTARQPIPLSPTGGKDRIIIPLDTREGFTAGPGTIVCYTGARNYFYPVWLTYRVGVETVTERKEYHSPKTVNPDSSLMQQRIIFTMNGQRNLLRLPQGEDLGPGGLFFSDSIWLPPITATFLPQPSNPVSAIYVQPGTNISFGLTAIYSAEDTAFVVRTDTIRDVHHNLVADGTAVSFDCESQTRLSRMETATWKGVATATIPIDSRRTLKVSAAINDFHSKPITLKSPL